MTSKENTPAPPPRRPPAPEPQEVRPNAYVGFANLPNQLHRKTVKKGFSFTVMVVGQSGLGKRTLVNSLFMTDVLDHGKMDEPLCRPAANGEIETTVPDVEAKTCDIVEKGVRLRLTIVNVHGFGDSMETDGHWDKACEYIDSQYDKYLQDEFKLNRNKIKDARVNCVLYFIPPGCQRGLRPLDIKALKELCRRANVIPIIAKADTLTEDERKKVKQAVLRDLDAHGISYYRFPFESDDDDEDDEDDAMDAASALQNAIPFAVIGATTRINVNGRSVLGRQYPWGAVSIEDERFSDFPKLRDAIIRTHMQDLKDMTHELFYENYRRQRLGAFGNFNDTEQDLLAKLQAEKKASEEKLAKLQADMEKLVNLRVQEQENRLESMQSGLQKKYNEGARALKDNKGTTA
eukprot:Clim_evm202s157 gene=Clim_evmTU202s157